MPAAVPAGDQVAVDEQHVAVDLRRRIHPGQFVSASSGWCTPTVQQPRCTGDERAEHTVRMIEPDSAAFRTASGLGELPPNWLLIAGIATRSAPTRSSGPGQGDGGADRRPQRLARLRSRPEIEVGNTVRGASCEDLADHAELKNR
jgi:hypothetical protein